MARVRITIEYDPDWFPILTEAQGKALAESERRDWINDHVNLQDVIMVDETCTITAEAIRTQ